MLNLPIGRLLATYQRLTGFSQVLAMNPGAQTLEFPDTHYDELLREADEFCSLCPVIGLRVSHGLAVLVCQALRSAPSRDGKRYFPVEVAGRVKNYLQGLTLTLNSEAAIIVAMTLPPESAALYEQKTPLFGEEVSAKFPSAVDDVEESGKCLALGRYTAVVFHLMRAMEAAVKAAGIKLGLSSVEKEWGKILSDMKGKIEALPLGYERNAWSENHSLLYHVKQAWRNDVMHPKAFYTEEQAKEVFAAVKSYMRNLAGLV